MEKFILQQPSAFRLIRIMFYLLFSVIVVIFVLVFTLNINDSVKIVRGELISKNTPLRYLAQFEAKIADIRVSEGQKVKVGDTLLILENKALQSAYAKTAKDVEWALKSSKRTLEDFKAFISPAAEPYLEQMV